MLPQFPKAQKLVDELAHEAMFDAMYKAGPLLLEIGSYQQHEGTSGSFQMTTGEIEDIEFKRQSVKMVAQRTPGRGQSLDDLISVLARGGADMGSKMQGRILAGIEAVTEKTGNVITIKDGVITPEAFLEMLEKVEIDFDDDGQPRSSWHLSPAMAEQLQKNFQAWQHDPEIKAKLENLDQKKKEEFRAREISRRLAR